MQKLQVVLILIISVFFASCEKEENLTTQNAEIGQEFALNKQQCAIINYLPEGNTDKFEEINVCFSKVLLDSRGTSEECEDQYPCGTASIEITISKNGIKDTIVMGMQSLSVFTDCTEITTDFGFNEPSVIDTLGLKICLLSLNPLTDSENKEATVKLKVSEL